MKRLIYVSALGGLIWLGWLSWKPRRGIDPASAPPRPTNAKEHLAAPSPSRTVHPPAKPKAPTPPDQAPAAMDALGAFNQWLDRFAQAAPGERLALVRAGVALARARQPVYKELIRSNPREALAQAVPTVRRQDLPEAVVSLLEKRVNGPAALRVYLGVGPDNRSPAPTVRIAEFAGGKVYQAYVYGRRAATIRWLAGASLHGVALDQEFAVHEDPSRALEVGECPDPAKPVVMVCPVSGQSPPSEVAGGQPITAQTPAVEAFGEIYYLSEGAYATVYREQLIQAEGSSGGAVAFTGLLPAAPTPCIGNIKVLVIPLTFADQNDTPASESKLYEMMRDVGEHYATASYGKLTLVTTVTPPVKLPHNEAWYIQKDTSNGGTIDGLGSEHSHARAEARKMGFDDAEYDCVVVRLRGGARPAGGWGGGSSVWIYGDGADVTVHEVGHVFGLGHANYWDTAGTSAIGAGSNEEYGGHWDIMGGIGLPYGHYNVQGKNQIRWLPNEYLTEITASGLYRIYAQDQAMLDPAKRFALKIRKDSARTYWGELRGLYTGHTTRTWADYGLILGWRFPGGGGGNWQLIDTTPGSPFGKDDSPISLGRTFSDFEAGIHLTTLAVNPATTNEPKSIDIMVNLGEFPTNRPPTLALTASAIVAPQNVPVTFTATASDPDGDALAYSWRHFGDANYRVIAPNSPVLTRSFTASGTYVVTCTVSDMKGGTAIRNVLVTVGNGGGKFTIAGRITLNGQGLAGVLVNANNANAVLTDTEGGFLIPNLSAGTYVLTALLAGYSFSELFNNSITVGPNFEGADFEAAEMPRVNLAATVPATYENTPAMPAQFTLTRTGDASQALTVNVISPSGTATRNTDYTNAPTLGSGAQGFSTLTIPAGEDTLAFNIIPLNDSAAEGPETVILELAPGNGYVLEGLARATVVINDDDSILPKVSLAVVEAKTVEGSAIPASLLFTRSGVTTGLLVVPYAVGGTATRGNDYVPLSGTLTIPAGTASATLSILSVNDTNSEPVETVTITISSSAAFLADPVANTATLTIVDDDVQGVTVVATDAVATERDLRVPGTAADTATFLVTRTGDCSAPLTVYYAIAGEEGGAMVTALHGVDYEALPGVLEIPAGQACAAVTILPLFDGLGEGPESVTLVLGAGPTNYRLGAPNTANIVINDAGDPPYVEVLGADNAVEGGTTGRFRFSLKGSTATNVVVNYTVTGTATSGSDYTALPGSITLSNNGTYTVDLNVTPLNDTLAEDLETITLTITPGAGYQVFPPASSATIWMMDNEQPTIFVDAHVSSYPPSVTETSTNAAFYLSRAGSTNAAVTVTYTLSGTASNGIDYQALSGTAVIPAGALGVDVPIVPINDTLVEGTETMTLTLAPGAYGRGAPATLYLTDNETPAITVGFAAASTVVVESAGTVNIPVTLSATSEVPVTVEYLVDTGSRATSTANGTAPSLLPYWVRCDRVGDTLTGSISPDGTNWTGVSTQTVPLPNTGYLAGLYVCSFNTGLLSTSVFDNVTITNLQPGGTVGSRTGATIGTTALAGYAAYGGGSYLVAGAGDNVQGTTDQGYFTWWPINNSTNCTIIARVVSQSNTSMDATAGVMLREGTANNVRRGYMAVTPGDFEFHYRTAVAATEAKVTTVPAKPMWFRLQRVGSVISMFQSGDGAAWTQVGTNLDLGFGPEVLAGLAVSSQAEGTLATAVFDNVTLTPGPLPPLAGRTVGFTAIQGTDTLTGGVYTITASADGVNGTSDDCYFLSTPVTGDFTLDARIPSLQSAASSPQAGVMARENTSRRVRSVFLGGAPGAVPQLSWRANPLTLANGAGIDFNLNEGVLTFPPGSVTQYVALTLVNDQRPELDEPVTLVLRNAGGARLGRTEFTCLIVDDDAPPALPFVGFAAAASSAVETAGIVQVPVTLSAPATDSITVDYLLAAGSAMANVDFTPGAGTLTFNAGDTVRYIPLTVLNDTAIESAETVMVRLSNPVGAQANTLNLQTFTIADDDSPVVTISSMDTNAAETGDPASVILTRTGPTNSALTVNLTRSGTATAGTDYTGINTSATIPAGAASVPLTLTPVQDTTVEGTETAIITVAAGTGYVVGAPASVTNYLADDDRNLITVEATDPVAVEGGAAGTFTFTRTGNTSASLVVNFTVTGTAVSGSDYTFNPTNTTAIGFSPGQATRTISVQPVNDAVTENDEAVLLVLSSGAYDLGGLGYASVTIVDNDIPPTVFISSPAAQGVVIAPGNGVALVATAADDGLPQPLTYAWTQLSGPGTVSFAATNTPSTPATFSAPGAYLVRVMVSDGQFTASDQLNITVGDATNLVAADWISEDIGPPTFRGYADRQGSNWVMVAAGTGFTSDSDRAHALTRQVTGDGSLVARLVGLSGPTAAEAGLGVRDSMHRYARRAALVYQAATRTLRFRPRVTNHTTDFAVSSANLDLPLWLKLDRVAASNTVAAFYATNAGGAPGPWTQIGTNVVIPMDAIADYGLAADSGSDTVSATALFDNLALTPAPTNSAILVEDFGDGVQTGTYAYSPTNDTHTLAGKGGLDGSGLFWGQQFSGDFILTALQTDATSSANDARSGIMIRDSMDNGPMVFLGRNPVGSFASFVWRTNPKGGTSGLNGITQKRRWLRLVRHGNTVTALHAPDNSGVPGAWVQLGQPQNVFLQSVVMAGLYCDNAGGVGLNTATFTQFNVMPLHKAPLVDAGFAPANAGSPLALSGAVRDDGLPDPFTTTWTAVVAPGPVAFAHTNALTNLVSFAVPGAYTLRLWADDGVARSFADVSFIITNSPFQAWQSMFFAGGASNPSAAPYADPDGDGLNNLGEYLYGANPVVAGPAPFQKSLATVGTNLYLRVAISKNPVATSATIIVEASSTLAPGSWSTTGLVIEENTATNLVVRDSLPVSGNPRRFLRIQGRLD